MNPQEQVIVIHEDGLLHVVGELPIGMTGQRQLKRAGHVLPKNAFKYCLFLLLRVVFGRSGKVAAWTRNWKGPWIVIIEGTGEMATFTSREMAVLWEIDRVTEYLSR